MKTLLIATSFVILSGAAWATGEAGGSRSGAPTIPCYKEGKMISASMEIPQCLKAGGHYKVEKSHKAE